MKLSKNLLAEYQLKSNKNKFKTAQTTWIMIKLWQKLLMDVVQKQNKLDLDKTFRETSDQCCLKSNQSIPIQTFQTNNTLNLL